MPNFPRTRTPSARWHTLPLSLAALTSTSALAHASTLTFSSDCSAAGDAFKCHLHQFLNLLYALAVLLGFALVIVILVAFINYRNNKQRPEDEQ